MGIALAHALKRRFVVVLMLAVLAAGIAFTADAKKHKHKHNSEQGDAQDTVISKKQQRKQKKEQKKEQKKKEKDEQKKIKHDKRYNRKHKINSTIEAGNASVVRGIRPEDEYPLTKMKDRYRVDILAPLYLDELVKGGEVTFKNKIPEKAELGLGFYEGVLIAADSLKKAGFQIDIYVHDVVSAAEAPQMLVAENKLDSTDLIIGSVQSRDLAMLGAYARKKQINFVSATSSADGGVNGNPYFTVMQPSLKSHCEWIAGNVAIQFPGMNVALLYRTSVPNDVTTYRYMTQDNVYSAHYRQLQCDSLPGKAQLAQLFDTTKPNVVIIPILDAKYADSLLTKLAHYFPFTHFEVYGMPSWSSIYDLRKEHALPNLSVNVTVPFHVDLSSKAGKYVTGIYKRDYGAKVPESAYRGYETMFWYANLLKKYGTIFNVKYEDNTAAPFTSFEMKPQIDKLGNILFYENKHVFLTKYEGGINKTE